MKYFLLSILVIMCLQSLATMLLALAIGKLNKAVKALTQANISTMTLTAEQTETLKQQKVIR